MTASPASWARQLWPDPVTIIDAHTISLALVSIVALSFAYHILLIRAKPNAPPLVKSVFPFISAALSFARNLESFLRRCQLRYGDIFTLYMAGKRMHIVCDPIYGIPTVFKTPKIFNRDVSVDTFSGVLFGTPKQLIYDKELYHEELDLFPGTLLSNEAVAILIKEFNSNLQKILPREIEKLDLKGDLNASGVTIDLVTWIQRIMFQCSGKTFFGETWPTDEQFFEDYLIWILGMYPCIFTRKAIQGRERYYRRWLEMFKQPLCNPSRVITERMRVCLTSTALKIA
jgi:Cytochrome P450